MPVVFNTTDEFDAAVLNAISGRTISPGEINCGGQCTVEGQFNAQSGNVSTNIDGSLQVRGLTLGNPTSDANAKNTMLYNAELETESNRLSYKNDQGEIVRLS